jgi:hypothetical protein
MAWENTYLDLVRKGIIPTHEANTSRYVHEVLCKCLKWKMEHITPQMYRRGYLDYCVDFKTPSTSVVIEVKKFGSLLNVKHIRKYLVRRGPQSRNFVVGALTNLEQWHIYVAGKCVLQVSGQRLLQLKTIEIRYRKDITHLSQLIGWRGNGSLKAVRASLGESPAVLRHLISNDEQVLKAIRQRLTFLKNYYRLDARVPQNAPLRRWINKVLDGNSTRFSNWSPAKLKQAVRSKPVVGVVNRRLREICGSRSRHNKLQGTIKQILKSVRKKWE